MRVPALLRRTAGDAEAAGAHPVLVDCRTAQPSPAGFLPALARVMDLPDGEEPGRALRTADRPVLFLDTFGRCVGLARVLRGGRRATPSGYRDGALAVAGRPGA